MGIKINQIEKKRTAENVPSKLDTLLKKEITLFGSSFNSKKKEQFYTELGVLLTSGIRLKEALFLIAQTQKKKEDAAFYERIGDQIIAGATFSDILEKDKKFTVYESHSIRIGEQSGTLDKVFTTLADFYTRKNEQRRNITSALTYPVIVLMTALLAVLFMLRFVVPMFEDIFNQNNVKLPYITEVVIGISKWIGAYGWIILVAVVLFLIIQRFLNKKVNYKRLQDNFLLRIPIVGAFLKTTSLARFTQAVSLLVNSKVSIPRSLELTKEMITFSPLKDALTTVQQEILKGSSLSNSLRKETFFEPKFIALVRVAEETNQTEFVFDKLNQQYNDEVKRKSKSFSTLLEPIIILIVGVLVAVILVAMYLPMFELGNVLK